MYQSKNFITKHHKAESLRRITLFIAKHPFVRAKAIKRKVWLDKVIEAALTRTSATARLQTFFVAIDILKRAPSCKPSVIKGKQCFEFIGRDCHGQKVTVHVREDKQGKDKFLMFISSFQST